MLLLLFGLQELLSLVLHLFRTLTNFVSCCTMHSTCNSDLQRNNLLLFEFRLYDDIMK